MGRDTAPATWGMSTKLVFLVGAPDSAAFISLGDDHVHPLGVGAPGMADSGHLMEHPCAVVLEGSRIQRRAAAVGDRYLYTLFQCDVY